MWNVFLYTDFLLYSTRFPSGLSMHRHSYECCVHWDLDWWLVHSVLCLPFIFYWWPLRELATEKECVNYPDLEGGICLPEDLTPILSALHTAHQNAKNLTRGVWPRRTRKGNRRKPPTELKRRMKAGGSLSSDRRWHFLDVSDSDLESKYTSFSVDYQQSKSICLCRVVFVYFISNTMYRCT